MSRTIVYAIADSSATPLSSNWLKDEDSAVITPNTTSVYVLTQSSGSYTAESQFIWNGSSYVQLDDNETVVIPGESEIDPPTPIPGDVTDYTQLTNKPKIEGITLTGNKTFANLGLSALTNTEIDAIIV